MKLDRRYRVLAIIQGLVGMMAIPAGLSLIIDPSGITIGVTTDLLNVSLLSDYTIPGWFLLIIHGAGNILGASYTVRRHAWTGLIGIGLGVILVIWILIQVYIIGLIHFLQPLFLLVGICEIYLSNTLSMSTNTQ